MVTHGRAGASRAPARSITEGLRPGKQGPTFEIIATPFACVAGPTEQLVGLRMAERKLGSDTVIALLQPIFRNAGGIIPGPQKGHLWESSPVQLIAREGYALAGLTVNVGADRTAVRGIQLIFMRIDGSKFNPADSYISDWYGAPGPPDAQDLGDGTLVIGVRGRDGDWIDAVGLLRKPPSSAVAAP